MKNPFDFDEIGMDRLHSKAQRKVAEKLANGTYTHSDENMSYLLANRYQEKTRDSVNYLRFVDSSIVSQSLDRLAVERAMVDAQLPDWEVEALREIKRLQGRFSSRSQKPLNLLYEELKKLDEDLRQEVKNPSDAQDLILGLGRYTKARQIRTLAKYSWEIQQGIIRKK